MNVRIVDSLFSSELIRPRNFFCEATATARPVTARSATVTVLNGRAIVTTSNAHTYLEGDLVELQGTVYPAYSGYLGNVISVEDSTHFTCAIPAVPDFDAVSGNVVAHIKCRGFSLVGYKTLGAVPTDNANTVYIGATVGLDYQGIAVAPGELLFYTLPSGTAANLAQFKFKNLTSGDGLLVVLL